MKNFIKSLIPKVFFKDQEQQKLEISNSNKILSFQKLTQSDSHTQMNQPDLTALITFLDGILEKHSKYHEHKKYLIKIGELILSSMKKNDKTALDQAKIELEDYLNDNLSLRVQEIRKIVQGVQNIKIQSPQTILFDQLINGLINQNIQISKLDDIASQILIEEPFNNKEILSNPKNLIEKIHNNQQIVILNNQDNSENIISTLEQILGLYPYIKQWLFLRKPLSEFISNVNLCFSEAFPFFQSLSNQDLIILLYYILPINEGRIIGESLANSYIPFPLIFKLENQNKFLFLKHLGFFQLQETKKSLISYVNLASIQEQESLLFCNKLLCICKQNNFEEISKSHTSEKSISLLSKIPHQFGSEFIFAKLSTFELSQLKNNDFYSQILESIMNQSDTLVIHSTKQEIKYLAQQQLDDSLNFLLRLAKRNLVKVVIIIDGKIDEIFLSEIQNFQGENNCQIMSSKIESLRIWECISENKIRNRKPFNMKHFNRLIPNSDNKEQYNQDNVNKLRNQEVEKVTKLIEGIENDPMPLLPLNLLQKEIMDCILFDVKCRINYEIHKIKEEQSQNYAKQKKYENELASSNLNDNIRFLFEFTLSKNQTTNREFVDSEKVFQLISIIQQVRGKYIEKYEKQYIEIQQKVQNLEQQLIKKIDTEQIEDDVDNQVKNQIEVSKEQIRKLDKNQHSKQVTFDMIINEINIAFKQTKSVIANQIKEILNQYFIESYHSSQPMQLIEGNTLQFGNVFLEELAKENQDKKLAIVSVIGLQSSAKSTLMNYLFQTDFCVGNGRVTKGLYFTRVIFEDQPMIVIDSEGLMSLIGRDQQYDNSIMAFLFLISDIVIINQKGEVTKYVKDLLELCKHLISQMLQSRKLPKVIFALRDQNEIYNENNFKKQTIQISSSFSNSDLQSTMKLDSNNMILFPPAFNEQKSDGLYFRQPNKIFSDQVLLLRKKIYELSKENEGDQDTFQSFYRYGDKTWEQLRGNCSNLIVANTIKEYEDKQILSMECDEMVNKYIKTMREQALGYHDKISLNKECMDFDQEISRNKNNFICSINQQIESSKEILHQFVIEKAKKHRLNDPKIIKDQIEKIHSEFQREKDEQLKKFEQKLEDKRIKIQLIKETESMDQIIIEYIKLINKGKTSKKEAVRQAEEKNKKLVERKILKIQSDTPILLYNMNIRQLKNWDNSIQQIKNKFKQAKNTDKALQEVYEHYYSQQTQKYYNLIELKKQGLFYFFTITEKEIDTIKTELNKSKQKIIKQQQEQLNFLIKQNSEDFTYFLQRVGTSAFQEIQTLFTQQKIKNNSTRQNTITIFIQNIILELLNNTISIQKKNIETEQNMQINNLLNLVKEKTNQFQKMLETGNDVQKQGLLYSDLFINQIKNHYETKMEFEINKIVLELVGNIQTPEEENLKAFVKCYNKKEIYPEKLIKFYLNAPKFITESIEQDLQEQKVFKENNLRVIILTEFCQIKQDILQILKNTKESISNQDFNTFETYFISKLSDYISSTSDLKAFLEMNLSNQKESEPFKLKLFLEGLIEGVDKNNTLHEYGKYISENIFNLMMKKEFDKQVSQAIGCCELCPYCRAKCMLQCGHSGDHNPKNSHRFFAYAGVTEIETKHYLTRDCYSDNGLKWIHNKEEYKDIHELNNVKYKEWFEHFQILKKYSQTTMFDSQFQKRAYFLVGEWFGNYFNKRFNENFKVVIPSDWKDQFKTDTLLQVPISKQFPGYDDE